MEKYENWAFEYDPNDMTDDDFMLRLKEVVNSLTGIQKEIFLLYCEIGTYAGVGRELGVCTLTAKKYIKHIKQIIYDRL